MNSEVHEWLERFGLAEHSRVFAENEIDLDAARDLNEQDLRELEFAMGPRKKLLRAIAALNQTAGTPHDQPDESAHRNREQNEAPTAERRQVTVLFADISGYTKLSAGMDPETTHALLTAYFDAVDGIIENFGGSVDKHIGDSVMAVFGAPVSHGNDPERAVRAATAIHEAMPDVSKAVGHDVEVHIGVASGQVVASGVGANEVYTVTGDSVNLASRLTDQAGSNETLLSETVMRSTEGMCSASDLGTLSVKGIADPVRAFRVVEVTGADNPQNTRRLVGRHSELRQLGAILDATTQTLAGHIIYLRGEAGIGKTRVTEEIEKHARERGFECHRALVLDFGATKGQDAIRSLTRSLLSLNSSSSETEVETAAKDAVREGLVNTDQIVFLNDLLNLPQPAELRSLFSAMDNARRNQGKRETFANIARNISDHKNLLLIVEDVHWADKLVMGHLSELSKALADVPAILMMTSRIEGDQIDDAWRVTAGNTPFVTIDLRPLRRSEAIELASEFFDAADKFANSCVERADGNPLFLEQLLRGAEAASEENVPGSVQSIVQARVDSLDLPEKMAIQAAAILGQRFSSNALQHMIEDDTYDCEALVRRHLVRPAGDDFLFAHALVRDGVYNSLLKANRNKLHVRAANWYKERDPGLYAQHLDRAGDPAAPKAYLRAANAQTEALSFESTITLCRRGLEIAVQSDDVCLLNISLGDALLSTRATEQAIQVFETATQAASNDKHKCTALSGLAAALRVADRQEPAFVALDEAQHLATRNALSTELSYIHYLRGNLCFPLGRIDECMVEHDKSLKFAKEIDSPEAQARALSGLADAHYLRGHMSTACERFKDCVELCQEHGFGQIEVANRHMIGWSRIHLMEFREALVDAKKSEKMARDVRNNRALMFAKGLSGTVQYQLGELEGAETVLLEAVELAKSMSSKNHVAQILRTLALVRRQQGQLDQARELASEALSNVRDVGMKFIGPTVLCTYAVLCDDEKERLELLQEAESILDAECVAHNQLWFADIAIDDAAAKQDWASVLRYADRLERFTQSQPLPWSIFMVRWARVLEEAQRDQKSGKVLAELHELADQATSVGLTTAMPALQRALSAKT